MTPAKNWNLRGLAVETPPEPRKETSASVGGYLKSRRRIALVVLVLVLLAAVTAIVISLGGTRAHTAGSQSAAHHKSNHAPAATAPTLGNSPPGGTAVSTVPTPDGTVGPANATRAPAATSPSTTSPVGSSHNSGTPTVPPPSTSPSPPPPDHVAISASPQDVAADGGTSNISVTVTSPTGIPLTGVPLSFSVSGPSCGGVSPVSEAAQNGSGQTTYTAAGSTRDCTITVNETDSGQTDGYSWTSRASAAVTVIDQSA